MGLFSQNQSTVCQNWMASFKLYGKSFSKTWLLGVASVAIIVIPVLFSTIFYSNIGSLDLKDRYILLFVLIGTILFDVYLTSMMMAQTYNVGSGQNRSLKELISLINKRFLKVIGGTLVVRCLFFLMASTIFYLPKFYILELFVLYYMFVLFSMVHPLILLDNHGVFDSLREGCVLIWGKWWRTFVVIFPLIFISPLVTVIANFLHVENSWSVAVGVGLLLISLIYPLFYSGLLVMFNDLKLRKKNIA